MRTRLLLVVCLAVLLTFAASSTAVASEASEANAGCLQCHDIALGGPTVSKVDFTEPTVDYENCNSCHWISNHWRHAPYTECNSCHAGWPNRTEFSYYGNVGVATYGYFTSAASVGASAQELHDIHVNGSWPKDYTFKEAECGSCHASAACDSCHEEVPAIHGDHALAGYPAVEVTVGYGTPTNAATTDTRVVTELACANGACHAPEAAPYDDGEVYYEENTGAFDYTGAWSPAAVAGASGGAVIFTGETGAQATATFDGPGAATLLVMTRNINGCISVSLDGGAPVVVDTWSQWAVNQVPVYTTPELDAGTHTLTVTALGTCNPVSYGTYVWLDAVKIVGDCEGCDDFVPFCTTCHATYDSHHLVHDASAVMQSGCKSCHKTFLDDEHAARGFGCLACHGSTTPAVQTAIANHDRRCEACHGTKLQMRR